MSKDIIHRYFMTHYFITQYNLNMVGLQKFWTCEMIKVHSFWFNYCQKNKADQYAQRSRKINSLRGRYIRKCITLYVTINLDYVRRKYTLFGDNDSYHQNIIWVTSITLFFAKKLKPGLFKSFPLSSILRWHHASKIVYVNHIVFNVYNS